jgi:hypothetical protein
MSTLISVKITLYEGVSLHLHMCELQLQFCANFSYCLAFAVPLFFSSQRLVLVFSCAVLGEAHRWLSFCCPVL